MSPEECETCYDKVEYKIHEGTGKKIPYQPGGEVVHKCRFTKKYWCMKCGAGIPLARPCVHKRESLNIDPPKNSLETYY